MSIDLSPNPTHDEQEVASVIRERAQAISQESSRIEIDPQALYEDVAELLMIKEEAGTLFENFHPEVAETSKNAEQEIYEKYKLPNIDAKLELIRQKIELLEKIEGIIKEKIGQSGEAGANRLVEIPEMHSRLKALLYILAEQKVNLDSVTLTAGTTTPEMKTGANYITVEVPKLNRLIQICDEEGDVVYVFKLNRMKAGKVNAMTRGEKNDWLAENPKDGTRIAYAVNWIDRVEKILFNNRSARKHN